MGQGMDNISAQAFFPNTFIDFNVNQSIKKPIIGDGSFDISMFTYLFSFSISLVKFRSFEDLEPASHYWLKFFTSCRGPTYWVGPYQNNLVIIKEVNAKHLWPWLPLEGLRVLNVCRHEHCLGINMCSRIIAVFKYAITFSKQVTGRDLLLDNSRVL